MTAPTVEGLVPLVFPESEVLCIYFGAALDALNAAAQADSLGLGWRLDAYDGPISDTEDQREWRLVAWKSVRSDAVIHPDRKAGA